MSTIIKHENFEHRVLDTVGDLEEALRGMPDDTPLVAQDDGSGRVVAYITDISYSAPYAVVAEFNREISAYNPLAIEGGVTP